MNAPDVRIEQAAEAAYRAGMGLRTDKTIRVEPWNLLPEWWKRIYRAQAAAILATVSEVTEPMFDLEVSA